MELALFLGFSGLFYYLIKKTFLEENKAPGIVTVGEATAKKAEDEFNIYEGVNEEELIVSLLEKGERLFKAKAYKNAEKIFLEVIKKDPKNITAFKGLGKIYLEQEDLDEAILTYEKVTVLDDKDEESWLNLGTIHYEAEDFRKASYAYKKAIEINPKEPERFINLAIIQAKMFELEDATESLEKSLKLQPSKESYKFLYGIYRKLGDIEKADKVNKALDKLTKGK